MFDRILVPLDRSELAECVLPHLVTLAHALDSRPTLLHVLAGCSESDGLRAVDPLEWQLRRAEAESYLASVRARLQETGLDCEIEVSAGDAADFIVGYASDHDMGLVVMASHGQSGLTGWSISSVVHKVVLRTHASLLVVRANAPPPPDTAQQYRRILVPLDGSARAEAILPLATVLARIPETRVLVTHVVQRPAMPRRTPPSDEDMELADRLVERNRAEAESYLETIRLQLPPSAVETHLLVADQVTTALHDFIEREQVDLVLTSAHGCSGQTRWPLGGVVASLLVYGTCPLLIFQDAPGDSSVLTQTTATAAVRNVESRQA